MPLEVKEDVNGAVVKVDPVVRLEVLVAQEELADLELLTQS
jgi:hypothetical protein